MKTSRNGDFDYGKIRDFVTDNIGTVEHYLRDQGIDLEHIGHNIAEGLGSLETSNGFHPCQ